MFIQLNKNIPLSNYTIKSSLVAYGKSIGYSTVLEPFNEVFSVIPERYRNKFIVLVMRITGNVPPHTDYKAVSTINVYLNPDNCITQFYDLNEEPTNIQTVNNAKVFQKSQLVPRDSFVAEKDEVWLLDVTKIHEVQSLNETQVPLINRVAIVLQTASYSFEQVKEMLKETGYIS
jgi:hypothetical protein